jgi:hypothetical protein
MKTIIYIYPAVKTVTRKLAALAALTLICVTAVGQPAQKSTGKGEKPRSIKPEHFQFGIISKAKSLLTVYQVRGGRVSVFASTRVVGTGVECTPGASSYSCPSGGNDACQKGQPEGEVCTATGDCVCGLTSSASDKGHLYYLCDCQKVGGNISPDLAIIVSD